jgi:signal recognition particle subunit SRP54
MADLMSMIPGMGKLAGSKVDEGKLKYTEAILSSMTAKERQSPKIIDGRRRFRIAAGSGTTLQEVNQVLKQFEQMQKMMKQVSGLAGKAGGLKQMQKMMGRPGGFPKM